MSINNFILILFGVLLNTIAQLCLKKGMQIIGNVQLDIGYIITIIHRVAGNIYVISGMICYIISFGVWLIVLSKVDVSLAYPLLSIGYVVTAIIGYYYFGESLSVYKICGIGIIFLGTIFLFKA